MNRYCRTPRPVTSSPRRYWSDPTITSDFSHELGIAADPALAIRDSANRAIAWIHAKGAVPLLYAALDKLAPRMPINGYDETPTHWYSPPPSGAGNCVGLVFVEDERGTVRAFGSNMIDGPPKPSGASVRINLAERLSSCDGWRDTTQLIADTLDAIAPTDWGQTIREVERCGRRFRAMPIFLGVLGRDESAFYCSNAIAEDKRQANLTLEAYGEVIL